MTELTGASLQTIGRGSYGTVWRGRWKGQVVAVKRLDRDSNESSIYKEVRQLSRVSHPNIITLYGTCANGSFNYIVMEYADGDSLHNLLHCRPEIQFTDGHSMSWAKQTAEGVAHLHSKTPPMIHRDLKPQNLLLQKGGVLLKICDFGTVTDKATEMTNMRGSAPWMAPEVFKSTSYCEKADVYSFGIILWELMSRETPYKDFDNAWSLLMSVVDGKRPPVKENCPEAITDLMTRCWDQEPSDRPTMEDVVKEMTFLSQKYPGGDVCIDYKVLESKVEDPKEGSSGPKIEELADMVGAKKRRVMPKNASFLVGSSDTSDVGFSDIIDTVTGITDALKGFFFGK